MYLESRMNSVKGAGSFSVRFDFVSNWTWGAGFCQGMCWKPVCSVSTSVSACHLLYGELEPFCMVNKHLFVWFIHFLHDVYILFRLMNQHLHFCRCCATLSSSATSYMPTASENRLVCKGYLWRFANFSL